jgi:DNA-binding transcriptional MocR family regulator
VKRPPDGVGPILALDRRLALPLHRQLYDGYREAILDGRLRPGQRLPSTRTLAQELRVSRIPVVTAFEQLVAEGYIHSRVGAGSFVSTSLPDAPPVMPGSKPAPGSRPGPRRLRVINVSVGTCQSGHEHVDVPDGTTLGELVALCDHAVVPLRASLASSPQVEPLLRNGAPCAVGAHAGRVLARGDEVLVLAQ